MLYPILGVFSAACFLAWAGIALFAGSVTEYLLKVLTMLSLSLLCISYSFVKQSQSVDDWRWGGLVRAPRWLIFIWRWAWPTLLVVLVALSFWMQVNPKGRQIRNIIGASDRGQQIVVASFLMFMHLWFIGFVVLGDEVAVSRRTRTQLHQIEFRVMDKILDFWNWLRGKR